MFKSKRAIPSITEDKITGISWLDGVLFAFIDAPKQATPKIKAIFEIFEPTIAPIAIDSLSFKTDEMPTKISGAEVPKATTVRPIVNSFIPSFFDKSDEELTNLSAPHTKIAIDNNRNTNGCQID